LAASNFNFKASEKVKIPKQLEKLAEKTKKYVRNRENLRMYRTYVYSVVRNIFLAYGENYFKQGIINEVNDIFFLSKHEVFSGEGDFKTLIAQRKGQKEEFLRAPIYKRVMFFNGKPLPVKYFKISKSPRAPSS
jgi:pyruvate,water dikinase